MPVRCLQTGSVRHRLAERGLGRYVGGGWREDALPVNCYLVERVDGLVLFDTGQAAAASRPGYLPRWHPFLRLARFELTEADEAAAQLVRLGYRPEDVRLVVLSHLHTDHVGGLAPFADADVLVTRTEWQRANGLAGRLRGYVQQHWPRGLTPRLIEFEGPSHGPFPASHDVAGDGTLLFVPLPGHTAGHAALLVREEDRRSLLVGDAARTPTQLADTHPEVHAWARRERVHILTAHQPDCGVTSE